MYNCDSCNPRDFKGDTPQKMRDVFLCSDLHKTEVSSPDLREEYL